VNFFCHAPLFISFAVARRWRVAEEVHIVRSISALANGLELCDQSVAFECGAGQRTQTPGVGHGNRQSTALYARHGRLNDRHIDVQQVL
jgi:hypothetical protein